MMSVGSKARLSAMRVNKKKLRTAVARLAEHYCKYADLDHFKNDTSGSPCRLLAYHSL